MAGSERVYQNFLLDSAHWDHLEERADDIIIATPYKCGTTWMQNIVLHLIFQDLGLRVIGDYSPWIDMRLQPIQEHLEQLEGQEHRRCLKSHLPRDGLYLREKSKYIIVGRDPRDVFMSFWNHYSNYTDEFIAEMNDTPCRVGPPFFLVPKTFANSGKYESITAGLNGKRKAIRIGPTCDMCRRGGTSANVRTFCSCTSMICLPILRAKFLGFRTIWASNAKINPCLPLPKS